ncbi:SdiA-regulated domain-containing protein [Aquimarina sp. RZ0]|uniref:SdiA-regulated domain-containing protein n=1 Tax=Aquimarina sp. RZ0 TaxID=2607730 RepID=UPI0011F1EC0E|nr:SdiA-regulated domain-containing protein [Aquimarina sp. RZ0]KAA1246376.1 hypothetical protein F0000_07990 [Aquimarina sp. RZ0]
MTLPLKSKILLLLLIASISVSCQKKEKTDLLQINVLSNRLKEISGITKISGTAFIYAINDSGNDNTLFKINEEGEIVKEFKIPNAKNIDWEDLTFDNQGNIYIGDFGNNDNKRKDLTIYKISGIDSEKIESHKIQFSLEDQKEFPPKKKNRNFDVEAFIYKNGSFFLFTKNRSSKFKGETKLYKVLAQPGKQVAKLITSFKIGNDPNDCFISSAAINTRGNKIVLLTYNKIFLLTDFKGDDVFQGTIKKIKLNHFSQKEGICFNDENSVFIVDEKRNNRKGKLYKYTLE